MTDGHHAPIDAGTVAGLTHTRVNLVGEVKHRGAHRQLLQVAFGREDEDLIGFMGLTVGVLKRHLDGVFKHLAYMEQPLLRRLLLTFIKIVRRLTRLSDFVHAGGADLHLKPEFVVVFHRGVQRLIT